VAIPDPSTSSFSHFQSRFPLAFIPLQHKPKKIHETPYISKVSSWLLGFDSTASWNFSKSPLFPSLKVLFLSPPSLVSRVLYFDQCLVNFCEYQFCVFFSIEFSSNYGSYKRGDINYDHCLL